jgi:ribonuclease E
VREKVSFLLDAQPASVPSADQRPAEPPAPAQPETEPASEQQPRKAGWWSRRFGSGE